MGIVAKPGIAILVRKIINPPAAQRPEPILPSANENCEVFCVEQGNFAKCPNPSQHEEKVMDRIQHSLHLGPGCLDSTPGHIRSTDPTPSSDQRAKSDIGCLM